MGAVPRSAPLALLGTEHTARGSAGDLQIRLLPHRLFARQCADERPAGAVVLHCYAEKAALGADVNRRKAKFLGLLVKTQRP